MDYPLGKSLRELPGPTLLTGHTGFKGTWMTFLLECLNLPVVGYSLPPEIDSLFDRAKRTGAISEVFADIRDYETLEKFVDEKKPSTIIHMAAQPLVLKSYQNPRETFDVNVMGTVNILDIAFKKDFVKAVIVVTTDKVYRNDNASRSFVETDPLEGKDPYSASKVGAEAVVVAWQQISKISGGPKVVSVRAGNVIGGGDFAINRIIPDIIRGVICDTPVEIRSPNSTRPWQHVLDPLLGYLLALEKCLTKLYLPHLNFGPNGNNLKVLEVTKIAESFFPNLKVVLEVPDQTQNKEALSLNLDSAMSSKHLNWSPIFSQEQAVEKSFIWWGKVINGEARVEELCVDEIKKFLLNRK